MKTYINKVKFKIIISLITYTNALKNLYFLSFCPLILTQKQTSTYIYSKIYNPIL